MSRRADRAAHGWDRRVQRDVHERAKDVARVVARSTRAELRAMKIETPEQERLRGVATRATANPEAGRTAP